MERNDPTLPCGQPVPPYAMALMKTSVGLGPTAVVVATGTTRGSAFGTAWTTAAKAMRVVKRPSMISKILGRVLKSLRQFGDDWEWEVMLPHPTGTDEALYMNFINQNKRTLTGIYLKSGTIFPFHFLVPCGLHAFQDPRSILHVLFPHRVPILLSMWPDISVAIRECASDKETKMRNITETTTEE